MEDMTENSCRPPGNDRVDLSPGWAPRFGALFSIWACRMVRISLAGVFIWSGGSKLLDPSSFALIIEAYGLVPEGWVMPSAITLPSLELIAGLGLLGNVRGSLEIVGGLLLLFMGVLGYGVLLGLDVDCGCFGPGDPEAAAYHGLRPALYRDFLMAAGVVYLYLWRYRYSPKIVKYSNT